MRYYRQGYEIPVALEIDALEKEGLGLLTERFNELHEQFYGYRMPAECEIVNLRAVGLGKVPHPKMPTADEIADADPSGAVVDEHKVYFEGDWAPTKIYDRSKLQAGNRISGPAIIAEYDSTTVVLSGFTAEIDTHLNILINPIQG
jgi:N-methylhydantoinase A